MPADEPPADESVTAEAEPGPPPDLADWWVWGVRKVAGIVGVVLLACRGLAVLWIIFQAILFAFARDTASLQGVGIALFIFIGCWGAGEMLARFGTEREMPDPERWLRPRRDT